MKLFNWLKTFRNRAARRGNLRRAGFGQRALSAWRGFAFTTTTVGPAVEALEDRSLLAGTSVVLIGGNAILTGDNGGASNDLLTISLSGANLRINDPSNPVTAGFGGTQFDANTVDIPFASITGNIQVNSLTGNDTLTVNLAGGDAVPTGGIYFNGGDPTSGSGDQLVITGGTTQGTTTFNYASQHDGNIVMSNFGTVHYTGLEPITNSGTVTDLVFNLPGGPSAVILEDDGTSSNTLSRLRSSPGTFETTDFANPTSSLTINRGNVADTLTINALPDFNRTLTLGGTFTPLDTITLQGNVTLASGFSLTANAGTISSTSAFATSGSGTVTLRALNGVTLTGASASITTVNQALTINADFDNSGAGNFTLDNAAQTISIGSGALSVTAADIALLGTINTTGTSTLLSTAGRPINLGTDVGGSFSLTNAELDLINSPAGTFNIGDVTSGTITVSTAISSPGGAGTGAHLTLTTGGQIAIDNPITLTTNRNLIVNGAGAASSVSINAAISTAGSGTMSVTGEEITVTGSGSVATVAQTVTLTADRMALTGTVSATTNTVTLKQRENTGAVGLNLGSVTDVAANTLELSDAELDLVTAGTLTIGDTASGPIVVSAAISRASSTVVTLNSASTINLAGGTMSTGGGNLTFAGTGVSPGTLGSTGVDVTTGAGSTVFGTNRDLNITINGTTVDTQYQQLNVAGLLNLSNADLIVSGSHTPVIGQTFTIVENDLAEAITGTFNGLAQGATIGNFMNSGLAATISYTGGSGNDVVLTVVAAPANTYIVDNLADENDGNFAAGDLSLREAITLANSTAGADLIQFSTVFNNGPGLHTILLSSALGALPIISQPVTIDGTSQPGYAGTPLININGNSTSNNILEVSAGGIGSIIKGLKISGFTGNAIRLNGADNVRLLDLDISDPVGNHSNQRGIDARNGSDNVVITGVNASGTAGAGILVLDSNNPTIQNNTLNSAAGVSNDGALYLINVSGLAVGAISGNTFTGSTHGLRVDTGMSGLVIGDASVAGAHIRIEDGTSGMSTVTGRAIFLTNVDNATIDNVDVAYALASRSGEGIRADNASDYLTIKNSNLTNRTNGFIMTGGGRDLTITNNNLTNNNQGFDIASVTKDLAAAAIIASDNVFTNSANAIKLSGMASPQSLTIGTAGGSNIQINNATDGLQSVTGVVLDFSNVDNLTIDGLNLAYSGPSRLGTAIRSTSSADNLLIQNVTATNRTVGISLTGGGSDLRVLNNILTNNGAALNVASLTDGIDANTSPLTATGNTWTNSTMAVALNAMSGVTIGDASIVGADIVLPDGQLNNSGGTDGGSLGFNGVVFLRNMTNVLIDNLDVAWTGNTTASGTGIYADSTNNNLTIQNVTATKRDIGLRLGDGGTDLTVTNNVLTDNTTGLYVAGYTDGSDAGTQPVNITGNTFHRSGVGLELRSMRGLVIGDASVAGAGIVLLDGTAGLGTTTSRALYLNSVTGATIDNLDVSWTGHSGRTGAGIYIDGTNNFLTIQNVTAMTRTSGLRIGDAGQDLTLLNNNLTNSGSSNDEAALFISGYTDGPDANNQPVIASGNVMTNAGSGLYLTSLTNQFVGASGTGIIINNATDGLKTASISAIRLNSVPGMTIDGLDLTFAGATRTGNGIYGQNNVGAGLTISNVMAANRDYGIDLTGGGQDLTLTGNNVSNTNNGIRLFSFSDGADGNSVPVIGSGNVFTNSGRALELHEVNSQFIGTSGTGIIVNNATDGLNTAPQEAIYIRTITNLTIDGLDLSFTGPSRTGSGINAAQNSGLFSSTIQNVTATNRDFGFTLTNGGQDLTLTNNNLSNNNTALRIFSYADGADAGSAPFRATGNNFASSNTAMELRAMSNLLIGDASVVGADVVLADGTSGLNTVSGSSNGVIYLNNLDNTTFDNLDLTWAGSLTRTGRGIYSDNNSDNLTLVRITSSNRSDGVRFDNGSVLNINNSTFSNNTTGVNSQSVGTSSLINNNTIQGNVTGVTAQAAGVQVNATNNFWGSAAGPGAGGNNGTSGNVLATTFLSAAPGGTPSVPAFPPAGPTITSALAAVFQVTTNADVSDGDTSSITNLLASQGADNAISLREAIIAANNTAGADTIHFNIGTGAQIIQLGSVLPIITEAVTIDGTSQPGFVASPLITIDANSRSGNIIEASGAAATLTSLLVTNYSGIGVRLSNADNSVIQNVDLSNPSVYLDGTGISVASGSDNVSITGSNTSGTSTGIEVLSSANPNIQNNTLSAAGAGLGSGAALHVDGAIALAVGAVSGNLFHNSSTGVRLRNMSGVIVGDAGVAGAHVVLADGTSGLATSSTALSLRNLDSSIVNNLDVAWTGAGPRQGTGIFHDFDGTLAGRSSGLTITNVTAGNRSFGMQVTGAEDLTVTSNTLTNNTTALYLDNVIDGADGGTAPIAVSGTVVTGSVTGLRLWNMTGLTVGTSATDVIVDNTADGLKTTDTAIYLRNLDNSTISGLDVSNNVTLLGGTGILSDFDGTNRSSGLTMTGVTSTNRSFGIQITGGEDLIFTSNTLTGNATGLYVDNVIDGSDGDTVPMLASLNTFHNSGVGLRLWNMSGVNIGPGAGNQVVIDNAAAGLQSTGNGLGSNIALWLRNFDNATVDGLNLAWTGGGNIRTGTAITVDNSGDPSTALTITNITGTNRAAGININNAVDLTLTNNNLANTGTAIQLSSLTDGGDAGTGLITASGNVFTGSDTGLYLQNLGTATNPISIGTSGTDILINNAADDLDTVTSFAIRLSNANFVTITGLDLTFTGGSVRTGNGIYTDGTNNNLTIQNVTATNRSFGLRLGDGGQDLALANIDLSNNGTGLYVDLFTDGADAGTNPMTATGLVFTGSTNGLDLRRMSNLIIGDASVADAHIVLPDGILGTITGTALSVRNLDNSTIDNVDVTFAGIGRSGTGLSSAEFGGASDNLTIQNVSATNRTTGISIDQGSDYILTNLDLSNNGTSLFVDQVSNDAGGNTGTAPMTASGLTVTGSTNGFDLRRMTGLIIGDASVVGAHFVIADGSLGTITGTALNVANLDNSTIDNVDVSFSGLVRSGTGIQSSEFGGTSDNQTIKNVNTNNRTTGISIPQGGTDFTLLNNTLTNNSTALSISSVTDGADAGTAPFSGSGNIFTGSDNGISLASMTPTSLIIGDSNVAGAHFVIRDNAGLQTVTRTAINLNNVDNVTIDGLDLSYRGTTRSGTGINATNQAVNLTVKNVTISNRETGLGFSGANAANEKVTVTDSNFLNNDRGLSITHRDTTTTSSVTNNRIEGNGTLIAGNTSGVVYTTNNGPSPASIMLTATGNYWGAGAGGPGSNGNNGFSSTPVSQVNTSGFLSAVPAVLFRDYGDAPIAFGFSSALVGFGGRHIATGPMFGTNRDSEADTTPNTTADFDDTTGTPDDEDGVGVSDLIPGSNATATVFVSNASGGAKVDAWIDFNRDGDWDDANEQIASSVAVVDGSNTITFPVPIGAAVGSNYTRFRISTEGGLNFFSEANDGEVEDGVVSVIYIDDDWELFTHGTFITDADPIASGDQNAIFGLNAFASVQLGIDASAIDGRIIVNEGNDAGNNNYTNEAVLVDKRLTLILQEGNSEFASLASTVSDATLQLSGVTLTVGFDNTSTQFTSRIVGTGALTKVGSGTLTLTSTASTFTGKTTINAGVLSISNEANLGGNPASFTADQLTIDGGTLQVTGSTSLDDANRGVTLGTSHGTILVDSSVTFTVANVIAGATAGNLTKTGTGTLTVTAANTYAGTTTISAGTLQIGDGGTTGTLPAGDVINGGHLEFNRSNAFTVANTISGTGTLTQSGSGTTTLTGTNSFSGLTTITAGALSISADTNLGTAPASATPGHLVINGGALQATNNFTLDSNRGVALGASAGSGTGAFDVTAANVLTYGGILADNGTGADALAKAGTGTLTLSGTNTYAGSTTVSGGTLRISADANLGAAPGVATPGHLVLNGGTLEATASFTLDANRGIALGASAGSATGSIAVTTTNNLTYAGILADNGTGADSLSKTDSGTLTLNGANTFTGTTTVNTGTLAGTGSLLSLLAVQSGATLSPGVAGPGTFTVDNDVTFQTGGGGIYHININGLLAADTDLLSVTGVSRIVTLNGATLTRTLGFTPVVGDINSTFTIIENVDAGSTVSGTFAGLTEGATFNVGAGTFQITYVGGTGGNDVVLTLTAVAVIETSVELSGGNLVITDISSGTTNDTLTVVINGTNVRVSDPNNLLQAGAGTTQFDANTVDVPLASITGNIQVNTLAGNDSLTVDLSGGNFVDAIAYDGGNPTTGPADSLTLTGGSTFALITHTFTSATAGTVDVTGNSQISYTGLEPITDNLSATNRVFTFNGGDEGITVTTGATLHNMIDSTEGESVEFNNPSGSLTINAGNGNDTVTISSIHSSFGASLTINGGTGDDTVNLNSDITFAADRNLDVDLTNDDATPGIDTIDVGANANLVLSGTGTATLTTSRNILVNAGASLSVVNGNLTLDADQETGVSGDFSGVRITGSGTILETTGTGDVSLTGRGGDDAATGSHRGIQIDTGAVIRSTSSATGAGDLALTGTGGQGTAQNYGVLVAGAGTRIESARGLISLIGQGSATATGQQNIGILLENSAELKTTGAAAISLVGMGGSGTNLNSGVVFDTGIVSAVNGHIAITGTATDATGTNNHGVRFVQGSSVTTTGDSQLTMMGTAESANPTVGVGIQLANAGTATLTLTGATNSLIADTVSFVTPANVTINAGTNTVVLKPKTTTGAIGIDLGGADSTTNLGLTDAELDRITAGLVQIGDSNSGTITVSASITHSNNLSLTTGAGITVNESLTSVGHLDLTAVGTVTIANEVNARGNGNVTVTTSTGDIQVNANVLSTSATSGNAGDGTGTLTLDSTVGAITTNGGGTLKATAGRLNLQAATGAGTSDNRLLTNVSQFAADVSGAGLFVTEANDLSIATIGGQKGISTVGPMDLQLNSGTLMIPTNLGQHSIRTGNGLVTLTVDDIVIDTTGTFAAINDTNSAIIQNVTLNRQIDLGTNTSDKLSLTSAETQKILTSLTIGRNDSLNSGEITISANVSAPGGGVTLKTGAGVTGTAGGISTNNLAIYAAGTVNMTAANNVSTLAISNAGQDVTFVAANGLGVGNTGGIQGIVARNVALTTQTGGLAVGKTINASGTVTLTSFGNDAFFTLDSGTFIVGTSGDHVYTADKMNLAGTITATGRIVTLKNAVGADEIRLGSDVDTTANTLEFALGELLRISASTLRIGSATAGPLSVTQDFSDYLIVSNVHLITGSSLTATTGVIGRNLNVALEAAGAVTVTHADAKFNTLAVSAPGQSVTIVEADGLTVGDVDGVLGIGGQNISLTATTGNITVSNGSATNDLVASGTVSLETSADNALLTIASGAVISGTAGDHTYTADKIDLQGSILATSRHVTLKSKTAGDAIDIGSTVDNTSDTVLELSDAELDRLTAGTINIGDTNTGTITVSAEITRATATNVLLTTGANNSLTFSGAGSLNANGGDVTVALNNAGSGGVVSGTAATDILADDLRITAGSAGIGASGNPLTLSVATLTTDTNDGTDGAQFLSELNSLTIAANDLDAGSGSITLNGGTFLTTATGSILSSVTVADGATLGGTGTTGAVTTESGGTVAPGTSPGILNSGNVMLVSGSTFSVEIGGTTPGNAATNHDQLNVTGTVSLGNATLATSAFNNFVPSAAQTFVIIANDDTDAITGTFNGLAEGAFITNFLGSGQSARISYVGGTGNDVVLTYNSPPVFTSSATPSVAENSNTAVTLTATDVDSNPVAFMIAGGADATKFEIVDQNGSKVLRFRDANTPNFEALGSAAGTNSYLLTVSASDGQGGVTLQNLTVTVTDEAETPLIVNLPTSGGPFTLSRNGTRLHVRRANGTDLIPSVPFLDVLSITINGSIRADVVTLDASMSGFTRPFQFLGGEGNDKLDGSQVPFAMSLSGGDGKDTLLGGSGNDTLDAGSGTDSLNGGAGNDNLLGGIDNDTLVGGIGDDVIDGGADKNTLIETGTSNITLTNTSLTGVGTDSLANVQVANLTVTGAARTFNVSGWTGTGKLVAVAGSAIVASKEAGFTLANTSLKSTDGLNLTLSGFTNATLAGGAGNDLFTVSAWTGSATLNGGGGTNTIAVTKNGNFTLTNSALQTTDAMTASLSNFSAATLTGGSGNNQFVVSDWTGLATLTGSGGTDQLVVQRDVANITLTKSTLATTGYGLLTLTTIEDAQLTGGAGDNVFSISDWAGTGILTAGDGSDMIIGASTQSKAQFTLTESQLIIAQTTASKSSLMQIVSMESAQLIGGASNNVFIISDWNHAATIQGQGGTDQVNAIRNTDMTLTNTALAAAGFATLTLDSVETANLSGGNSNNLLDADEFTLGAVTLQGGNGNDILLGGTGNDVLLGGSGDDSMVGNAGRDLLIGGTGTDSLDGGGGDDILIGGTTSHDGDDAALIKIMAEWTRASTFAQRTSRLINGGGKNEQIKLNNSTVQNDSGTADSLTGGSELDWFFESSNDIVVDFNAGLLELKTPI